MSVHACARVHACEGKVCARLACVHGGIVWRGKVCVEGKCAWGKICPSACGKQIVGLWKTNCGHVENELLACGKRIMGV